MRTVQRFRSAVEQKDFERARAYVAPEARIWYENRSGAGGPWKVGSGTWATWDAEFHSHAVPVAPYRLMHTPFGPAVWTVVEESNDFYRLTDRSTVHMMFTWYMDDNGLLSGFQIAGIGEPTDRFDEFETWARQHAADELNYLMPGGKIDPTKDRAPRFRVLLNRWRAEAGMKPIQAMFDR